jgi:hypothetical protein
MNTNTKKIIAREFLIFISIISITIIAFFTTYLYNFYLENKIKKIQSEIENNTELISKNKFYIKFKSRQNFFNSLNVAAELVYKNPDQIWERLEYLYFKDSINYKWNYVWKDKLKNALYEFGIKNSSEFNMYIKNNIYSKEDLSYKKASEALYNKNQDLEFAKDEIRKGIFDYEDKQHLSLSVFIILFSIAYLFRYLILAVIWSIKTIKDEKK